MNNRPRSVWGVIRRRTRIPIWSGACTWRKVGGWGSSTVGFLVRRCVRSRSQNWGAGLSRGPTPGSNNRFSELSKDTCNAYSLSRRHPACVRVRGQAACLCPQPTCILLIGELLSPTAQAKSKVRSLLDRVLGKTMPEGIVKTNGRIEATQVDVAAKYPGRLVDITVEEGSEVKAGQVVGRVSSPEYEAQLRAAQSNVERAKQSMAEAESLIDQRNATWRRPNPISNAESNSSRIRLSPSKLSISGAAITKGPRQASRERLHSAIKPTPPSRARRPRSSASSPSYTI